MHLRKFVLLFVTLVAATANEDFQYAEKDLQGSCPKITYIYNFSMPRVTGWWYRAFSTLTSSRCLNNEGHTMYAVQYDEDTINLEMCCRSASTPDIATCGSSIGSGFAKVTSKPGEFVYYFDNKIYYVYVLDTDYKNFAIVYGCKPGSGKHSERDELIFVFSRGYELSDALEKRVRDNLLRNGADWSKVKACEQGPSIPYTPGNKPCSREPECRHHS